MQELNKKLNLDPVSVQITRMIEKAQKELVDLSKAILDKEAQIEELLKLKEKFSEVK